MVQSNENDKWAMPYCDSMAANGRSNNGLVFEEYCVELLLLNGFSQAVVTTKNGARNIPRVPDYGADILAERDGVTFAIQCKCHSRVVDTRGVLQALGGKEYHKVHVGVILTNQRLTHSAKELANGAGIIIWDREKLTVMLKKAKEQIQ